MLFSACMSEFGIKAPFELSIGGSAGNISRKITLTNVYLTIKFQVSDATRLGLLPHG